jgi:hypothetical protein
MARNFIFSIFAIGLIFTSMPTWALMETNSEKSMDTAFLGDATDKADEIQILDPKDIALLDDQKLVDAYIDAVVEIDATKTFHSTSGFTPKEFKKYKSLLKYRLQLFFEIHRRKMEIPAEVK